MLEQSEGTLGGPEAGGGRERRASICAQRRPQRQQISAEQGAHTEEKEVGEKPNAQFRMKQNQKKPGGEDGIWRGEIKQNLHSLQISE